MDSSPKKAFVFSGGFGKRMQPITLKTHKSLIEVAGKPLLDHAIDKLTRAGITDIYINTHYKADDIQSHLQQRQALHSSPQFHITYEPELLETGGTVEAALSHIGNEPFFTLNPDTLCLDSTTPALTRMVKAFDPNKMLGLLLIHPVSKAVAYPGNGDFDCIDGKLFFPVTKTASLPYVYTGIGLFSPQLWKQIPPPQPPYSINHFFKSLRNDQQIIEGIDGLVHDGDWLHIGTPGELEEAKKFITQCGVIHSS